MVFRDKLDDRGEPLTLYEVIPPADSVPQETVEDTTVFVKNLLSEDPLDAINIPEVREEDRNGQRKAGYMQKMDPRDYGQLLRKTLPDQDIIVNHVAVHAPPDDQRAWLEDTFRERGFRDLVLVGGESSDIDYPGPDPPEAAELTREVAAEIGIADEVTIGGITIPTRDAEAERILAKQEAGIEFFTGQVIFESESTKQVLARYADLHEQRGQEPPTMFLSFAPITGKKDAEFLKWLGVEIPPHTEEWILSGQGHALDRSVRVAEHVLQDVMAFADRQGIDVPIGLNVEHIMRYNFEASEILLDQLGSLLEWVELKRDALETR